MRNVRACGPSEAKLAVQTAPPQSQVLVAALIAWVKSEREVKSIKGQLLRALSISSDCESVKSV